MLTEEEIRKMKAGPEMDAKIALLMGWTDIRLGINFNPETGEMKDQYVRGDKTEWKNNYYVPCFSTDILAMWHLRQWALDNIGGVKMEAYCDVNPEHCDIFDGTKHYKTWEKTMPLALARAVLLAKGVE